jgi:predicted XRE-type DNA-binding protein
MPQSRATSQVPPRPSITLFASSLSMPETIGEANGVCQASSRNILPRWAWRLALELGKTGMSRAELARRVGVSAPTVTDWLNGHIHMIAGDHLVITCGLLGINPTWLITGVGKKEAERFIDRRVGDRRRRR